MILKQPALDAITTGVNPVSRILPVLAIDGVGGTLQELGARAAQFVKGQEYTAQVLGKVTDTAYNVRVMGGELKGTILQMELGKLLPTKVDPKLDSAKPDAKLADQLGQQLSAQLGSGKAAVSQSMVGQTLTLKYLQDGPTPTFLLTSTPAKSPESTIQLSPAANLLGQYLKEAEVSGVPTRYEANAVVSLSPKNPQVMAQDLKQAVSSSGLFYESHLSDVVQGGRTMASIAQEPQNQAGSAHAALMSQQLAILENQRMSWHGQVWPGQNMDWDVYLQERDHDDAKYSSGEQHSDEPAPISSELTLHLPYLGKVSAHLSLIDGRMRINIMAEQAETLETMRSQRISLAEAISKNGQQLDVLTLDALALEAFKDSAV